MKINYLAAIAGALALAPVSAMAAATTYKCEFKSNTTYGGIPPEAYYAVDLETGEAAALDWSIQEEFGEAINVSFKQASAKRVQLKYTLNKLPGRNENGAKTDIKVSYTVSLNVRDKNAKIRGILHGSHNEFAGSGPCVVVK
ncbi:hypothetical protein [Shimia biformata]|uniref:hypothetical protein n=1 Tax=Shimia biformata TaxID=1294299 RepID=UPI0019506BB9|nr:hypothetical protein [Shimia biformata]